MSITRKNMVFHTPYPLDPHASSASGIRPVQMRNAFASLGYTVWEVTGHTQARKKAIERVTRAMSDGIHFDFCYSESSTMPLTMTEPNHVPLNPFFDFAFLRRLRRSGVKVGHFLRDIYWLFPAYRTAVPFPKRSVAQLAYRWDVRNYQTSVDRLYVPSLGMASYLDINADLIEALPPGHSWMTPVLGPSTGAHLFYVGSISSHYKLHTLVEAVSRSSAAGADVSLTICTPPAQWDLMRPEYARLLSPAVRIVHGHGDAIKSHYEETNIGALLMEPDEYRDFAAPVKLFDYLGSGKPILATAGTFAGDLVAREGIGWSLPYETDAVASWLTRIAHAPALLAERRREVEVARQLHTWEARAAHVANDLSS